ncbi:hypothetical protein [Bacillus amyloliquefaciens]|uniref:hypothetical protein n=1 Tax=Bacillus amyloliquefaciens TaxID=1390 RepID=UPI002806DDCA|nr:hypothetical protein [Bacillus amyloliquefaciens]MDQ8094198.1 hypothetical protein [Bacillus amyloliquefaciens]
MVETKEYVRIKKASYRSLWYADKIGRIFPSLGTWENAYKVDSPDRALYIRKEDAEIIVTENRRPKVGERVLITNGITSSGVYKTGDICTVLSVGDIYGTITVKEHGIYVMAREYEVIVNSEVENEEADEMKIDLNAMGYDELMAHGDAVMEAIKKRMYQEGFRSAKQAQRKLAKMNAEKSSQARRDEIVEQAKADVEKLIEDAGSICPVYYGNYTMRECTNRVEFVVNREKRTVVALVFGKSQRVRSELREKGIAKAAPDDCFNAHIGKAIALRRALGLAVPDEYLNAPQPTDVRVGDVVSNSTGVFVGGVLPDDSWRPLTGNWVRQSDARKYGALVIDDSREEVGE